LSPFLLPPTPICSFLCVNAAQVQVNDSHGQHGQPQRLNRRNVNDEEDYEASVLFRALKNQKGSIDIVGAANSIIPCRNDFVHDGASINSPSSTALAQAEEDRHRHKQESALLAQVRIRPKSSKEGPAKR
jgi:hypothetical protein